MEDIKERWNTGEKRERERQQREREERERKREIERAQRYKLL